MRRLALAQIAAIFALIFTGLVATPSVARADIRDFTLVNASSTTIFYVYVSAASTTDWEEDVMGDDVLIPGDRVKITFDRVSSSNCVYDIKVVGSGGEEGYMWAVDLCSTSTVTFY